MNHRGTGGKSLPCALPHTSTQPHTGRHALAHWTLTLTHDGDDARTYRAPTPYACAIAAIADQTPDRETRNWLEAMAENADWTTGDRITFTRRDWTASLTRRIAG